MSGCLSSSMTGSTDAGLLQPQEDPAPLPPAIRSPSTLDLQPVSEDNSSLVRRAYIHRCHQPRRKMTSGLPSGQAIQLTPLWEHVVRTRTFPSEVDTQTTFVEISERLRDPEWEVRQHALRVLMDVLPTLNVDVIDKVMQPVVPELINNLGHPAPAVRKGALDTLRVYLVHSPNRDSMVKNILHDGLNRPDAHNPFQTNVTTGVILSAPLLLFPSSNSPSPATQILKDATIAFASRLVQIPHQEAVLKSLMKIRDAVGEEEFESYLADYDDKLKKNIDILSKIYNIKPSKKKRGKNRAQDIIKPSAQNNMKERSFDKSWDSDSDTSGIAEEEDEASNTGAIPPARVVLETEIKFNEATAITMTILEEKDEDDSENDDRQINETDNDTKNEIVSKKASSLDKRKTPRRVHFGGEIVKLRTPDSDETESIEVTSKTRIPLPVSPATKMPGTTRRRPSSQPCSPHTEKCGSRRASRSASSSPKRETYMHNAQLSPKKSILTRTGDSLIVINSVTEEIKNARNFAERRNSKTILEIENSCVISSLQEIDETSKKEENMLIPAVPSSIDKEEKSVKNYENNRVKNDNDVPKSIQDMNVDIARNATSMQELMIPEKNQANVINLNKSEIFEDSLKRERNIFTPMRSSPKRKVIRDNRDNFELEKRYMNNQKSSENDFPRESKINADTNDFPFGSPVNDTNGCDTQIDNNLMSIAADDEVNEAVHTFGVITNNRVVTCVKYDDDEFSARDSDSDGQKSNDQHDRKSALEGNGSVTCSSSEGEGKPQESNWEELGLVGQEVLDDLHNKDDWRARVRGLERVASALRTSSALIAIESRLGSLLHAVLGGERSCRVAAAGLAVAKVVVAGVSEDALRKKLPQLAWGLARQGGPTAAQLARIAMLRLKPSLLLEQLLQTHCLCARNAKTRENALQLLIFSLVTFPSTEFNLDIIASRIATMIVDRRRRVRQAALDTLAVLGQIYDPEEVLEVGRQAAEDCADAEAMVAAIRARLARKSLPLVSADGLVVYGLQISPTVQIATGPDVDWIIAGSGSVSPGTGRTKGQIIATSRSTQGKVSRNESMNNCENPWIERPNLVALGVGLQPKVEQSTAWQILPSQTNDDNENEIKDLNGRNINAVSTANLRFEEQLRSSYTLSNQLYDIATDVKNHKEFPGNNFEQKTRNHKEVAKEVAKEKENATLKGESKIPILSTRDRSKAIVIQNRESSINSEYINSNSRKQMKDVLDNNKNRINPRKEDIAAGRSYAVSQRRKRLQKEENQVLNQTFDSHYSNYHSSPYMKTLGPINRECSDENREAAFVDDNLHSYGRFVDTNKFTNKNENSDNAGGHQRLLRNMQQQTLIETYNSIYERQRKLVDRNAYRLLRTAPNSRGYQESQNLDPKTDNERNVMYRSKDHRMRNITAAQQGIEMDLVSSDPQNDRSFSGNFSDPYRRRLRSLSPSQLHRSRQFVKLASGEFHATSMYDIDKMAVANEEKYNAHNKRHFSFEKNYRKQNSTNEDFRYQVGGRTRERSKSTSSSSSDVSRNDRQGTDNQDTALRDYHNDDNSESSTPRSQDADDPAFDIITQQTTNRQDACDDVDSFFTSLDIKMEYPIETANAVDEVSKEWSSEDDMKPTVRIGSISKHSNHEELMTVDENCNRSTGSSSDTPELPENGGRRKSIVSVIPNERILHYDDSKTFKESLQSKIDSPKKLESQYQSSNHNAHHSSISNSPSKRTSRCSSRNLDDVRDSSEERIAASTIPDKDASIQPLDAVSHSPIKIDNSPAIIIASKPHSHETVEYVEDSRNIENANLCNKINAQESTEEESSVNDTLEDRQSKDSASETNMEPGILKIEPQSTESIEPRRRAPSKVPIRGRCRFSNKTTEKPSEKCNRMVQQCFAQLESKDWEITMKGLKALSQISKQYPKYLDTCAAGMIGRLLGRHIKNLRSQVARAACQAASDVFSSQIRGIDQDLDDIAGPLLHRTADTNRFLRSDSNSALDQMIQHLPPHKTIGIIVLRGASHQNAIVRATTARLLSDITDRIGPDHIMILPRDVKDKLLNTGAKLLMDGNLDARNHSKRLFRRLTRCEGFRKALTDAVPETTLRHIDKTMKTL